MSAYYNEFDPYAAQWLRNLIAKGLIPAGDVDERSIVDVAPADLAGYVQCHFFAGIGGWALAARLAGWPDDREIWSGSLPCQPFSVAGEQRGFDDERDLWHHQLRLIRARRPLVFVGEQVAAAIGKHWLDRLFFDLQAEGYAGRGAVIPACAVNAPHRRDRIFVIADSGSGALDHGIGEGLEGFAWHDGATLGRPVEDRPIAASGRGGDVADAGSKRRQQDAGSAYGDEGEDEGRPAQHDHVVAGHVESAWRDASWIIGHDGKARRAPPSPPSGVMHERPIHNSLAPPPPLPPVLVVLRGGCWAVGCAGNRHRPLVHFEGELMDAHKYDEGPSPRTQDYVEAQANRLGLDEDRAWELYYAAVKKWPDASDPLGHYDYYDFHDEGEDE